MEPNTTLLVNVERELNERQGLTTHQLRILGQAHYCLPSGTA